LQRNPDSKKPPPSLAGASIFGHVRRVVLGPSAKAIVQRLLAEAGEDGRFLPIRVDRFRHYFRKAVRLAGVQGFVFHDTRHEAISRMAEVMDVGQLKAMSGHRSMAMLGRYVNARPKDRYAKLG
jgi:integrase